MRQKLGKPPALRAVSKLHAKGFLFDGLTLKPWTLKETLNKSVCSKSCIIHFTKVAPFDFDVPHIIFSSLCRPLYGMGTTW